MIAGLSTEIHIYQAIAYSEHLETEEEKTQWWARNEVSLPYCLQYHKVHFY